MRALIVAVGSRGDVAPFTGLATAMNAAGHPTAIAAYQMFAGLVTGCGLEFRALPGDPRMLDAARWQRGGTGPLGAARLVRLIAAHMRDLHAGMLAAARQRIDVLLLAGLSYAGGYHIAEGLGLPSMALQLSPVAPTRDFPPSIVTARSLGRCGNLAAGHALVILGAPVLAGPVRELRAGLGLRRLSARQAVYGRMNRPDWPVLHGFSPAVVPRPADWRPGAEVVGYWWPARPQGWRPRPELEAFLNAGPAPVFVGFGSMTPADANREAAVAAAAARQARVRLVLQAGGAGLDLAGPAGDSVVVGDVPHDWLFPRMAAVVHHAGAGTTAAGLRAGVPAVTVPMIGDQPFWAARIAALGAGPPPIRFRRLSVPVLAAAIRDAVSRPSYRARAQQLAARLADDDAAAAVVATLDDL
ncbi:MAG TPA: glycosyltransferase [Streptosporangiaceae bacterium]|nr:glycosyltransferase [Streptosporangiaceae bacterium]